MDAFSFHVGHVSRSRFLSELSWLPAPVDSLPLRELLVFLPTNISLRPPNSIDCAGILKLRNADIELKKGETDIGRKNTRVRVVFRVAVPQPDGQALWLQAASVPVECCECQRKVLSF